jgi:hypothetical protein
MFISFYVFSKLNFVTKKIGDDVLIEHTYAFRGKTGKRYIVTVEQYDYSIHIIKFCLQERKIYSDRFNQLTHLNECSRVLTTIGEIMKHVLKKNPFASFGFVGTNLPVEEKNNTKRFKLYRRVVSQIISPVAFEHKYSQRHSAYLLLNRNNQEIDLLNKVTVMFERIYLLQ